MTKLANKKVTLAAACLLILACAVYAASQYKIYMNGVVISDKVVIMHNEPYVPLADLARALSLQVARTSDGWSIAQGSSASQAQSTEAQSTQSSAPQETLPLTNIPAKVDRDSNSAVVVNNEKANVINMANTLWYPLSTPQVQDIMGSNWTPPMTIKGQTYGNGYLFEYFAGQSATLIYWLKGRHYTTLTAMLGLDDHVEGNSGAAFKVTFTGNGKMLANATVSPNSNPVNVTVPISGVTTLRITVSQLGSCPCYPALDIVNPTLSK